MGWVAIPSFLRSYGHLPTWWGKEGRSPNQKRWRWSPLPSKGGGGYVFSKVGDGHPSLLRSEVAIPLPRMEMATPSF